MGTKPSSVGVRCVGIIVENSNALVIRQVSATDSWYCFPGGHLEHSETPEECVIRELEEELSLRVTVERLIACGTYVEGSTTSLEMYFICRCEKLEPAINEPHIKRAELLPIDSLRGQMVYPLELTGDLPSLVTSHAGAKYYGRFA